MADNMSISTAGGTVDVASDEVASVQYQRVKIVQGADGSADADCGKYTAVDGTNALPVTNYMAADYMSVAGAARSPVHTYTSLTADGALIAAVTNKKILLLAMSIMQTTASEDLDLRDGAVGGTILWSMLNPAVAVFHVLPFNPVGWMVTTSGNSLYADITGTGPMLIQTVHLAI